MVTRLFFVRHGATPMSAEDRFSGSSDPPLSDAGIAQAAALGDRLRNAPIAAIYSSTKQRAIGTATVIARPHDIRVREEPDLREIDHGHWEGMRQAEVMSDFAAEYAAWKADPSSAAPLEGEPGSKVLARALPVIRRIVHDNSGRTVLVVSHKATIRLLATAFLSMPAARYRDLLALDTASFSIFEFAVEGIPAASGRLVLWNDVSHLRPDETTAPASNAWTSSPHR